MDLNGGNVERLTIDTAPQIYEDKDPAWCGDNLIVFSRRFVGSGEDWQVWVMDAEDGGNKDNLTNGNGDNDEFPACPGRGGRVAFTRDNASMMAPGISDIWIYSLSSESEQNETESQCPPELDDSYDSGPSWSPGETQITFSLKDFSETNPAEIYKFTVGDKTDGIGCGCGDPCLQTLVQLTDNEVIDIEPDWGEISP
jgi:Tol biopolymer transport system component